MMLTTPFIHYVASSERKATDQWKSLEELNKRKTTIGQTIMSVYKIAAKPYHFPQRKIQFIWCAAAKVICIFLLADGEVKCVRWFEISADGDTQNYDHNPHTQSRQAAAAASCVTMHCAQASAICLWLNVENDRKENDAQEILVVIPTTIIRLFSFICSNSIRRYHRRRQYACV